MGAGEGAGRRASRLLSGGALLCAEKLALNLGENHLGEGPGLRGVGFVVILKYTADQICMFVSMQRRREAGPASGMNPFQRGLTVNGLRS